MQNNNPVGNAIVIVTGLVGLAVIAGAYRGSVLKGVKAGARMRVRSTDMMDLDRRRVKKAKRLMNKYERKIARAKNKSAVFAAKEAFDKELSELV